MAYILNLSPKFLAKLCWVVDAKFTDEGYQRDTIYQCVDIKTILDIKRIDIEHYECVIVSASMKAGFTANIIVFKSSDSKEDWQSNYDIKLVPSKLLQPSCCFGYFSGIPLIHSGFYEQFKMLDKSISEYISKHPSDKTIVTGFSLGGALASICSYFMETPDTYVITFGAPRVGNQAYVVDYQTKKHIIKYERWVFENDPVPRLPPPIAYRHIPGLKYITMGSDDIYDKEPSCFNYFRKENHKDHDLLRFLNKIADVSII